MPPTPSCRPTAARTPRRPSSILSDGAANTGPSQLPATSPYLTNPCGQGVTSAGIAKAADVLVYSIAYTAQGDSCWASVGADVGGTPVTQFQTTPEPGLYGSITNPANAALQAWPAPAASTTTTCRPRPR